MNLGLMFDNVRITANHLRKLVVLITYRDCRDEIASAMPRNDGVTINSS